MLRRGLSFCFALAMASVAQAGAVIELVCDQPDCTCFTPGQTVQFDVKLKQSPAGANRNLRFVQFDLSASSPALLSCAGSDGCVSPFAMHTGTDFGTIRFWDFGGINACPTAPSAGAMCGDGHFIEDVLTGARPKVMSDTFYFVDPAILTGPASAMRVLPGDGSSIRMGRLTVKMPGAVGNYTLNVINASQANPDLGGGDVRWGYGIDVDGNALTTWRSPTDLTGGTAAFQVAAECNAPVCTVNMVGADPLDEKSLWRTAKNIVRLTFDGAITAPTPGQLKIRELLATPACGSFGPDLSANFTYTVEPGNKLKIRENVLGTLQHRHWYEIRVIGCGDWNDVNPLNVQYVVQVGDADANRFVTAVDVGQINASPTGAVADNSRFDIDGNGFRTAVDVGLANASQGGLPAKPCGH